MTYPPSNNSGFIIGDNTIVFENFSINYKGNYAIENQPMTMYILATTDQKLANQITNIYIYFDNAVPYPMTTEYSGSWGVDLTPSSKQI
jgi:hypothetical protein